MKIVDVVSDFDDDSLDFWMGSDEPVLGKVLLPAEDVIEWINDHGWETSVSVLQSNVPFHACFVRVHSDIAWFKRKVAEAKLPIIWE